MFAFTIGFWFVLERVSGCQILVGLTNSGKQSLESLPQSLMGPSGPYGPRPYGPGAYGPPVGPHWPGPYGLPWALMDEALMEKSSLESLLPPVLASVAKRLRALIATNVKLLQIQNETTTTNPSPPR